MSLAGVLVVAALSGGSSAIAHDSDAMTAIPLNQPSLAPPAVLSATNPQASLQITGFADGAYRTEPAFDAHLGAIAMSPAPYALLGSGESYFNSTIPLDENLSLSFNTLAIDPQAQLLGPASGSFLSQVEGAELHHALGEAAWSSAGIDWAFSPWGVLGLEATQSSTQFGAIDRSNGNTQSRASNTSVGVTARMGFGDGWVTTLSYNQGLARTALRLNAIDGGQDALHGRGYSFAVAKHGLFDDNDSLGLTMTRPLQLYGGGSYFGRDNLDGNLAEVKLGREFAALANNNPETDLELGYVTTFMDGAIALQANAGYQMNVDGLGSNALSVVSRAKINF